MRLNQSELHNHTTTEQLDRSLLKEHKSSFARQYRNTTRTQTTYAEHHQTVINAQKIRKRCQN